MAKNTSAAARAVSETALCTAILVICSWISVPTFIPFTMQTFAAALAGAVLGGKRGVISILLYILLGAVGLPVFAGFRSGAATILCPSGGYIIGFIFLAGTVGFACDKFGKRLYPVAAAAVLGLLICYAFGTVWYAALYARGTKSITAILSMCVFPYIIPDAVKLALAIAAARKLQKMRS